MGKISRVRERTNLISITLNCATIFTLKAHHLILKQHPQVIIERGISHILLQPFLRRRMRLGQFLTKILQMPESVTLQMPEGIADIRDIRENRMARIIPHQRLVTLFQPLIQLEYIIREFATLDELNWLIEALKVQS